MKNFLSNWYLKSPDQVLDNLKEWFSENKKLVFFVTLIIGLITHAVLLSVIILSPDGLWNSLHFSAGVVETTSGRWAINLIDSLRKDVAIPILTTVISILVTSVTAIFIVDFFDFKSKFSAFITGMILAVSPCLTLTLLYAYTADAYAYAFLFSVISAWLIYKEKNRIFNCILASIFLMLTIALYQSYLGVTIALCIMKPILDVLKANKKYREIFINIGISILVVVIGIVLYYVSENIALNIYNTKLSSYGGAEDISIMNSILNLKTTFFGTYRDFARFFIGDGILTNNNISRGFLYKIYFAVLGISLLIILIFRKAENKKIKIIDALLVCLAFAFIPVGMNIILIIAPNTNFYELNSTQMLLMIPFGFAILEMYEFRRGVILKYIAIVICFIIGFTYYIQDNVSYFCIRLKYNQAYSMTVRMVDRIENAEGYSADKPWVIVGIIDENNTAQVTDLIFLTYGQYVNTGTIFHGNYVGSNETWRKYLNIFLGIQPNLASPEVYYKICGTEEFKEMPIFPNPGSVREIDGTMVVKYTNNVPE